MKTLCFRPDVRSRSRAFTLVEIMVSLAVLTILLMISAQVIGQVQSTWSASNARVSQFKEARTAFDILTRNISQATLNTYIDYENNYLANVQTQTAAAGPGTYKRKSELQFICGPASTLVPGAGGSPFTPGHAIFFQAPLGVSNNPAYVGLDRLLCTRGYFVQFSSDEAWVPDFIPASTYKFRYRLMEFSPPAELNSIYIADKNSTPPAWIAGAEAQPEEAAQGMIPTTRPVADNIVALIISPRREAQTQAEQAANSNGPTSIAPNFVYNSVNIANATGTSPQGTQHLLPPLVQVVLVAIDERSADRLEQQTGAGSGEPPLGDQINPILTDAAQLNAHIKSITTLLQAQRLNYRVFSGTVSIRGAKWSL